MAVNLVKHVAQSAIYTYGTYPLSAGQKFYTDANIYYEDIEADGVVYRCAIVPSKLISSTSDLVDSDNLVNNFVIQYDNSEPEGSRYSIYYYDVDGVPNLISSGGGGWTPPAATKYDLLVYNGTVWEATNQVFEISFDEYTEDDPINGTYIATHALRFTTADKTLSLQINGVDLQIGQEMYMYMKNDSGATIADGMVVKSTGSVGSSEHMKCAAAVSTEESKYIVGVSTETIAPNAWGFITIFGVVRNINPALTVSGATTSSILYLSESTPGLFQTTLPSAGHSKTPIAMVLSMESAKVKNIFVRPTHTFNIQELDNVEDDNDTTGQVPVWNQSTQTVEWKHLFNLTKDPTGFDNNSTLQVALTSYTGSYGVTITQSYTAPVEAYWRGEKIINSSTWVSPTFASTAAAPQYLSYNGSTFAWSTTPWAFNQMQIAIAEKTQTGEWFAVKETHGFMPWTVHQELHDRFGTYKVSGALISGVIPNTDTPASARRPFISETVIKDEDVETTLPALNTNSYTILSLSSTSTANFLTTQADIVKLSGGFPLYNLFTGGVWTEATVNNSEYTTVWLIALPAGSDTTSQKYRFIWLMGQSKGNFTSQQNLTPASLNLGEFSQMVPEFVFLAKFIIEVQGGKWWIDSWTELSGDKTTQILSPGGVPYHQHTIPDVVGLQDALNDKISKTDPLEQNIVGPLSLGTGTSEWQIANEGTNFKIQEIDSGVVTDRIIIYETTSGGNPDAKIKMIGILDAALDCGGW